MTAKTPKKKKPAMTQDAALKDFKIPEWLDAESWQAFLDMRKRIKKPMSLRAANVTIGGLQRLRDEGNDPGLVLDQSEYHNWQGIFPLKDSFLAMVGKNRDGSPRRSAALAPAGSRVAGQSGQLGDF